MNHLKVLALGLVILAGGVGGLAFGLEPTHYSSSKRLARLSSDDDATWSQPQALVNDLLVPDRSYPSSVQRPDEMVVTAYYARLLQDHRRYHMGMVIWSPPGF